MAHTINDGDYIVDWKTGDPEGDRAYLFQAYRNFFRQVGKMIREDNIDSKSLMDLMKKWDIRELNIDDFPRISINYPSDFPEHLKKIGAK